MTDKVEFTLDGKAVVADQGETIWDYNADSVEFRAGYYAQLGCYAPNHNIRIALPTG